MKALDLFAGCGGASHGLATAGYDVTGIECWADAVESHQMAGHPCVHADITRLDPNDYHGYDHAHFSPPCTTFSSAGKGKGRLHLADLALAVKKVLHGEPHGLDHPDDVTLLTLEPARFLAEIRPTTTSFEQVRAVLPVWQAYADALADLGYSAWAGVLHAEQYGVPQARARAWLIARRDGKEARPPTPTHSRYYPRTPEKLDPGVARWVTMADALGWAPDTVSGFPRRADSADIVTIDGVDYQARDLIGSDRPANALTEKARSQVVLQAGNQDRATKRADDQPAPTVTFGHAAADWQWIAASGRHNEGRPRHIDNPAPTITGSGNAYVGDDSLAWEYRRPSTTVCGDPRLSGPGRNDPDVPGSQFNKPTSRRLSVKEALVLQGFPADYPLHGSKTSQFKQVGNAVPPPLMEAVINGLRGNR